MSNNGKFLNLENGKQKLDQAINTSVGVADASKIPMTNSLGKLDETFLPDGVGPDLSVVVASEALGAGKYVNFWLDTGTIKVRLADFSNGRDAHGFVKAAVLNGANATVYFEGPNSALSGLTGAARYYLDAAGGITTTPKSTGLHQFLGLAVSTTQINTDIEDAVVLS